MTPSLLNQDGQRLRVLHVGKFYPPYKGGMETHLQDLCRAVRDGTPQRSSGALGLHVLEVLLAIRDSAREGASVAITPAAASWRHAG